MLIREIKATDAEALVKLILQVETESKYMLYESGERNTGPDQQRKRIEMMQKESNSIIFVAEDKTELVGYLFAVGGNVRKNKHTVYLVIGIANEYRGLGIGTKLFKQLLEWAKEESIHRLELTVATPNEAGVKLYKKMGFEIEGTKRDSLYIDGKFVDEYYMSKIL